MWSRDWGLLEKSDCLVEILNNSPGVFIIFVPKNLIFLEIADSVILHKNKSCNYHNSLNLS